jgi:hypothetical protein
LVDPDLKKDRDFHFKNRDFPGFRMDVHPDIFNDGGSFPDADPPSEPEDDPGDKRTVAETYFNNNGNNMKKIIAMATGLNKENTDVALVDVSKEPWATKVPKKTWKLTMSDLKEEIVRRVGSDEPPRLKHWNIAKCFEWLKANPIVQPGDVEFIRTTVRDFVALAAEAAAEAEVLLPATRVRNAASWRGNVPYIRLILCLVEDELIRHAYLHRLDALSRTQLDARNSDEQRELDVHEMLAEKWNDSTFNPILPSNDVHEDYRCPTDCSHEKV